MKLTSVEIHPANSASVAVLSFRDPGGFNPYNVKAILGLDADEIVPKYYGASGTSKFYELAAVNKTIVVKVGLNPNHSEMKTYSDLRDDLYRMIYSSRTGEVQLRFKNGEIVVAAISGFVNKFESAHFERDQEVQITIKCNDSMLRGMTPESVDVSGLSSMDAVIDDEKSTAPHGFTASILVTSNIASLTIADPASILVVDYTTGGLETIESDPSSWGFALMPVGGFFTYDIIHISNEMNEKSVYVQRGDTKIYLADVITPASLWPLIFPGENHFALSYPSNVEWQSITYYPTYWGV